MAPGTGACDHSETMSITIQLLGRPSITRGSSAGYKLRSRKSWGLLAYLILSERPAARSQLASLLFAEADDPVRALRWCLAEIRRALGDEGSVDGDPVVLRLPPGAVVDVQVVMKGTWTAAVGLPGLGADLLDGMTVKGGAAFETWLLAQQRHAAAASEAVLHEAALGSMARGALEAAIDYAVRAAAMSPLDENHQALLIRLYRTAGDDEAAARQFAACAKALRAELGVAPGPAVQAAMRQPRSVPDQVAGEATIEAIVEAGVGRGVGPRCRGRGSVAADRRQARRRRRRDPAPRQLPARAGRGADPRARRARRGGPGHPVRSRRDRAGPRPATTSGPGAGRTRVRRLPSRPLRPGRTLAHRRPGVRQQVTFDAGQGHDLPRLGGKRPRQLPACRRPPRAGGHTVPGGAELRRQAYALSMLGRISLFRDALDAAAGHLDASIKLAEDDDWLAFLPWPQALRGEVQLARADPAGAAELLEQAFARACQLGDPCWEAMAARGLALVAEAAGETERAIAMLAEARAAAAGGRTLSLALWVHPRRAVRPRPAARPSGDRGLGRDAAQPGVAIGDERTHAPLAPARRRARPAGRQHRRGRAGGRARRIPLARRAHGWDSHGYRSVSLAA